MTGTVTIYGYTFEHLQITRELGNPVRGYAVETEQGYYIHKPSFRENEFKTKTALYSTDDLANVIIVAASDLPVDAEINGVKQPSGEVM